MKIIYLSITLFIVINFSWSQNNQFVYYQDDKFKLGCDDFLPVVMNYPVQLCKKFNSNEFYLINDPSSCTHYVSSECSSFSCGKTKAERQAMIVGDLKKILELGFNTIRLCIGSPNLCDIGATPFMCISNYFGETAEENHCLNHYTNIGSNIAPRCRANPSRGV